MRFTENFIVPAIHDITAWFNAPRDSLRPSRLAKRNQTKKLQLQSDPILEYREKALNLILKLASASSAGRCNRC